MQLSLLLTIDYLCANLGNRAHTKLVMKHFRERERWTEILYLPNLTCLPFRVHSTWHLKSRFSGGATMLNLWHDATPKLFYATKKFILDRTVFFYYLALLLYSKYARKRFFSFIYNDKLERSLAFHIMNKFIKTARFF